MDNEKGNIRDSRKNSNKQMMSRYSIRKCMYVFPLFAASGYIEC